MLTVLNKHCKLTHVEIKLVIQYQSLEVAVMNLMHGAQQEINVVVVV